MEYAHIPGISTRISRIGLGSWLTFGSAIDREKSERCIRSALDRGVNLFDTAPSYGDGQAEIIFGATLSSVDRSKIVILSKVHCKKGQDSYRNIRRSVEGSLSRLKTEYIDLIQVHNFKHGADNAAIVDVLSTLKQEGLVRAVGVCNWSPAQIEQCGKGISCTQFQYNLLWRYPEDEVIAYAKERALGTLAWSPLAQGVLTGKYMGSGTNTAYGRADNPSISKYIWLWRDNETRSVIASLSTIARRYDIPLNHLALGWVIRRANLNCAITGATTENQIHDNCDSIEIAYPSSLWRDILSATGKSTIVASP